MDKLPDRRHLTLRRWRLKATRPLLAAGKRISAATPTLRGSDDKPLIPAEKINSSYVADPETDGVDGERIGQGVHAIPLGREVRLAYEIDRESDAFYVRRTAYFDGEELGEDVETIDVDPQTDEVASPFRDIADADPEAFAEAHFTRRPGAELFDGFAECLQPWQKPKDYPLDPHE
jgi:hypothetical protein